MILNGMRSTRTQQNGQILVKVIIVALVLASFLSGCSTDWCVGDGRGDWTLDLYKGYAISRINSNEILLIHKENPNDSGGSIVVQNYFVTAYQLHEPYICLEGICTKKIAASEDELNDQVLSYYIVDTSSGKVIGPFESYHDFEVCCTSLTLEIRNEWTKTNS